MARPLSTGGPVIGKKRLTGNEGVASSNATREARAGFAKVKQKYNELIGSIEKESPVLAKIALIPAFEESQRIVPVDTHALKNSGYLEIVQVGRRGNRRSVVEIGYGRGGEPPYAAVVHENMQYRHKKPTQAKFLQKPLLQHLQHMERMIAKEVQDIIEGTYSNQNMKRGGRVKKKFGDREPGKFYIDV